MRLGVVLRFIGFNASLVMGLRQRCNITFSKGSVWMIERDSNIH